MLVETSSSYGRGLLRGICRYSRVHGPWTLYFEPSGPTNSFARLDSWNVDGSPHQEFVRSRIERIKELFVQTDWPLKQIDTHCGFKYPENLYSFFRREAFLTPGEYRAQQGTRV